MESVISYRPSIGKKKLLKLIEPLPFESVNKFIDFAVMCALSEREDPKARKLMAELVEAVYRNAPLRFVKPTQAEAREIRADYEAMKSGKIKSVRMHREYKP